MNRAGYYGCSVGSGFSTENLPVPLMDVNENSPANQMARRAVFFPEIRFAVIRRGRQFRRLSNQRRRC